MTPDLSQLRPLRDDDTLSEPELLLGRRLLTHAQPLSKSDARRRRVWNALSAGRSSRLGFRLGTLHVAFASVLFAAVSSAAVGGYYVKHRTAAPALAVAAPATPGPTHHRRAAKRAPFAAVTPPSTANDAATTDPPSAVSVAETAPVRPAPLRGRAEPSTRKPAASDADAELLVEAMRARGNGNAKRVSQLVDEYRARHPQGVLQEEALILSIESAVAQHAPNASALAREYLARFPAGRFALQARRALGADAR